MSVQASRVGTNSVVERGGNPVTRLIHNYIFWAYERGSLHYDVLVTTILLFIFVGPHFINFHDRPVPTVPLREAAIVVKPNGIVANRQRYLYEIRSDDLGAPKDGTELSEAVENAIDVRALRLGVARCRVVYRGGNLRGESPEAGWFSASISGLSLKSKGDGKCEPIDTNQSSVRLATFASGSHLNRWSCLGQSLRRTS